LYLYSYTEQQINLDWYPVCLLLVLHYFSQNSHSTWSCYIEDVQHMFLRALHVYEVQVFQDITLI